ncbi:DUF1761 domain-containing protein [Candidatus Dependentiae bacterium]|nr:MAG: DUF1761 domain-containing protein [Candidatus Dependentiae bacterium]
MFITIIIFKGVLILLAIITAALVYYILGWAWYSPLLFAKRLMKSINLTQEQIHKQTTSLPMALALAGSFLICLAQTVVLYICIVNSGINSITQAMLFAGTISFTFSFLSMLRSFVCIPKEIIALLVHTGYNFVGSILVAKII